MPALHNYLSNGTTERTKGYEAWLASREKEEGMNASNRAFREAERNEKVFHAPEATRGYSNMRQASREIEGYMIMRNPAPSAGEYDEKVFAAAEATKGYTNLRQAISEKDENMFGRNLMFSEGDRSGKKVYSAEDIHEFLNMREAARQKEANKLAVNSVLSTNERNGNTYSSETGRGHMNMKLSARQKEQGYALSPVFSDDGYNHKTYAAEAGRGYTTIRPEARQKEDIYSLNSVIDGDEYYHKVNSTEVGRGYKIIRQAARKEEEALFALNPILSADEYGHTITVEAGGGFVYVRQAARPNDHNMFALNPVLSNDEYNPKIQFTQALQGYANTGQGVKEEKMLASNQAFGKFDLLDKVIFKPSPMESTYTRKVVALGPWGGNSGELFDDGVYTSIREIELTRAGGIVSIRVCYDMEGKAVWGTKNGGNHGTKVDKIVLDYPSEYLTHISGYYGSTILRGPTMIKSLTFHTNKHKYGPFGDEQGISFSSAGSVEGKVVGFSGRIRGWYVGSIGVHVMEGKSPQSARDVFNMNGMMRT